MSNPLVSLSEQLASTVEQAGQSVVAVHGRSRFDSSGVHWSPGIIVTADHALRRDDDIRITTSQGSTLAAELVGRDPGTDLAVLRVKDLDVPVAVRAEAPSLQSGNVVLAVGRSKDSALAAFGVLSGISGSSQTSRGGRLDQVVRLDLGLHPGASGGAVVDASGKLIGIATPALSRVSVFAVPLETITRVTGKLLTHGRIPRGYLGIGLQPVGLPEHLISKLKLSAAAGLIAISVDAEGPAGRAGAMIGDVLLELAGHATAQPEDVQEVLDPDSIGKKLTARILRGGSLSDIEITIGERQAEGVTMKPHGFGEVAEKLRRSTVRILNGDRRVESSGSGVVWTADGTVITNAHVVRNPSALRAELWDGRILPAEVAARDARTDLAKLKVNVSGLPVLASREARSLRAGELVVAVGNPLGFVGALTTGVMQASGPVRGLGRRAWVQAAIRLAPGNSGGPLADAEGRVIGINTMVVSGGLALAIPSETVLDFLKRGSRSNLGVVVRPVSTGILVLEVSSNSAAERGSLLVGDVLIAANGRSFESAEDLSDALDDAAGGVLKLRFLRGDRRREREVSILLTGPREAAA